MSAIGYAVLPTTLSMKGIGAQLSREFLGPATKASSEAARRMSTDMAKGASDASAAVKKANAEAERSTAAVADAQEKVKLKMSEREIAARNVETAELKASLASQDAAAKTAAAQAKAEDAVRKYGASSAQALQAEGELATARDKAQIAANSAASAVESARNRETKAAQAVSTAETDLAKAKNKAAEAGENATAAQKRLDDATKGAAGSTADATEQARRFSSELRGLANDADLAGDKAGGFGDKIMGGLKTIGKGALLGVGAKISTGIMDGMGSAMSKGMDRFVAVEQARSALTGLGNDAQAVEGIMENALASVSGTAFGFGDAAGLAGQFVASGIEPGQELTRVLKIAADTAAITGNSLSDIGPIYAKVAANGKMSATEMNQLLERNLGILPELAKHYGVTNDEVKKMVSEGKVSFADFSDVMENMVGGSAQAMGNTFTGSMDNFGASLGRLGEKLLNPVLSNAPLIFNTLGEAVDIAGKKLEPLIQEWSEKLAPVLQEFVADLAPRLAEWIGVAIDKVINLAEFIGKLVVRLVDFVKWFRESDTAITLTVVALGALTGALVGMKILAVVKQVQTMAKAYQAWKLATEGQTIAQRILNGVTKGNAFVMLATVLVGVGTALWAFFTKTEKGREIWAKFMNALEPAKKLFQDILDFGKMVGDILFKGEFNGAPFGIEEDSGIVNFLFDLRDAALDLWDGMKQAWESISEATSAAWENFIKPVLGFIGDAFGLLWEGIKLGAKLYMEYLKLVWSALSWAWENVISPVLGFIAGGFALLWEGLKVVFDWIATTLRVTWDVLTWAWENVISPVLGLIGTAFSLWWEGIRIILGALGDFFVWVWEGVIKPAWDALGAGIDFVWQNIIRPAWDGMKIALQAVGDFFSWVWNSLIKPAWDALGAGIRLVIDSIVMPAWDRMKGALDAVRDRFVTVVDAIKGVWGSLTDALKKPVAFLINTVWNEKLVPAWNKVGGPDGFLPGLPAAQTLPGFRQGGAVFGPGTTTSDSILARLSDNEHVLTAADVDALGGHGVVYALREMARQGRPFTFDGSDLVGLPTTSNTIGDLAGAAPGLLLPGFKDGGAVLRPAWMDQLEAGHRYATTVAPAPYVLGGSSGGRPGGPTDCSGFMGEIADAITGGPVGVRSWATMSFPDRQAGLWQPGLGPGFSVGIVHGGMYGGHTAGTLTGVGPFGTTNVESGGNTGQGATYGGPAAGADHPQFTEHHHLRIGADGAFETGGSGPSPEQQRSTLRTVVQDLLDKALDPVKAVIATTIGTPPPELLGTPAVGLDVTKTAAVDEAFDFIEKIGDGLRSAWNMARNFTGGLLRDNGGFIPPGLSIVRNETGVPEPVLTAGQWRGIHGLVGALTLLTPEMQEWVAGGLDELERIANATEQGFREWSQATEEQGRMGHAGEFAAHYGNELAAELADGALGLIGLDGIIGSTWKPALVDFVEELGLAMPALAPAPILDDSGRVIGTQLARSEVAMASASTEVGETARATAESHESGGGGNPQVVNLSGDAFTAAQVMEMLEQLDGVEAKVDELAEGERASITTRKVLA